MFANVTFQKITEVVIILAGAYVISKLLCHFIRVPERFETRRAKTLTTVGRSLVSIFVYAVAVYVVFKILGIDVTPFLASAGIAGLALGFGARSLVEDLLSGAFLLIEDSIAVGDLVRAGSSEGIVKNISFRTITLQDKNGALHIIPNGKVGTVVNLSRVKARVNVDLTLPAETKIDPLLKVAEKTLQEIQKDKEVGKRILSGSQVKGIEKFTKNGKMVVKIVLFTNWRHQWSLARRFRYLLKRNLEKSKIPLA